MRSLLLAVALLPGCATVFAADTRTVEVLSDPPGATVTVDGQEHDEVTPTDVELEAHRPHSIRLELEGHKPRTCRLEPSIGVGWVVIDVVLGLLPVIVDAVTGAWSSIPSSTCDVSLRPR